MSKSAITLIVILLCVAVVTVLSATYEDFNRMKRIISEDEEKDMPQLTRVKRVRREGDKNDETTGEGNDVHARIKKVRKETKVIEHKLERALSRMKRIGEKEAEKTNPKALERVKRYRRRSTDDEPAALKRSKRVRKDTVEEPEPLQRVKRTKRKAENVAFERSGLHKRSGGNGGDVDKLNRVKRHKRDADDVEKTLDRFKRVKRSAENPQMELSRLTKRKANMISDIRMQRVKRE
ncbi:transcriptional regulator ATRX homolog [Ptychodera flava]|uniref:transcriptional regulator ATRX homolog n=1 Tax=Ptychodera flava TaxID=63121 RepID=UPI00396A4350